MVSANSAADPGPMSTPDPSVRDVGADLAHLATRINAAAEPPARAEHGQVVREEDPSRVEEPAAGFDVLWLEQRRSHLVALRPQEGKTHTSAHYQPIHPLEQGADHAELVAHFAAAQHRKERSSGTLEQARQDFHLPGHHPAGGGWTKSRRADDGGVGPVGGTKGFVDEEVLPVDKLLGEAEVAGLLPRIEPQIVE